MGCTVNIGLDNELYYYPQLAETHFGSVVEEVIELLVFKLVKATKMKAKPKKVKCIMVKPKKMKAKTVKAKKVKGKTMKT